MFKLIFKRDPLLILLGGFVSGLGSMMMSFALSLYVLDVTGSGTKFASVLAMAIIPRLIFGPFAGVLSDRISRKKTMVVLDIASGLVTLIFVVLFMNSAEKPLIMIYIFVFILTSISIFFEPSSVAIVSDVVKKDDLPKYNSIMQFLFTFTRLLSPAIAGLLYSAVGITSLIIINGISFLASAISEMFIKIENESIEKANKESSFFKSFTEGIKFIKGTYEIMLLMFFALIGNLAFAPIICVSDFKSGYTNSKPVYIYICFC
jgi:MFS family permease